MVKSDRNWDLASAPLLVGLQRRRRLPAPHRGRRELGARRRTRGTDGGDGGACESGASSSSRSDYKSTNIAISTLDGTTLSGSFVSSGATKPGLDDSRSRATSTSRSCRRPRGACVIIDRYGTNVLTWMNLSTRA